MIIKYVIYPMVYELVTWQTRKKAFSETESHGLKQSCNDGWSNKQIIFMTSSHFSFQRVSYFGIVSLFLFYLIVVLSCDKSFNWTIYIRYNRMINMIKIRKNSLHTLRQSWGSLQHTIRLYILTQENVSMLNPARMEIALRVTQVLSHYNWKIPRQWKVQAWLHF